MGTRIPTGGEVKVTVAAAEGSVQVPDLRNRTERDAITLLFAAGLSPGIASEAFDPIVPAGLIAAQDPPALTQVAKGTAVAYTISTGPEPSPSESPSESPSPSLSPEPTLPPTPEPTLPPTPEPTLPPP